MERLIPDLSGSPENGGIDPAQPIPRLNLAGSDGFPAPKDLIDPASASSIHTPDFGLPDMATPDLHPYNLVAPGIDYSYAAQFAPDPPLQDLSEYARPFGLDIQTLYNDGTDLFRHDPLVKGWEDDSSLPQGLHMIDHPLQADPTLPALQHPQLDQEIHMPARPGDLAPNALDVMRTQPTYEESDNVPYTQSFMDQSGMNTARRRHMDLLQGGLENLNP